METQLEVPRQWLAVAAQAVVFVMHTYRACDVRLVLVEQGVRLCMHHLQQRTSTPEAMVDAAALTWPNCLLKV